MSNSPSQHQLLRELTVPCVMATAVALFVYDSTHLSYEALVFPVVLIVVMLASLAWALGVYLRGEGALRSRRTERTTRRAVRSSQRRRGCSSPCLQSLSLRSTISAYCRRSF